MDSPDLIIVGSGPAGAFAALGARGKRIVMLDVGLTPPSLPADPFGEKIGARFESLYNLVNPPISLKLKSPGMTYIAAGWRDLTPVEGSFGGVLSLAKGGLANGWGAGVYRFFNRDLDPFYDEVERHIGVCGAHDELEPYLGRSANLLPPLALSPFFERFLARYERRRAQHLEITVGRSRLAVRTADYAYDNREFFRPCDSAVYNPAYTIDSLAREGAIDYRAGMLVSRYAEVEGGVVVFCRNLSSGSDETFTAGRLVLAAGAINTARIALQSNDDYSARLPLYDNPMAAIPFFDLRMVGSTAPARDTSLAQLNLVTYDAQGSLYGGSGPLRTDVIFGLPLSARANIALTKYLAPAMGVCMLFSPGPEGGNLRLLESGALDIHFEPPEPHPAEGDILRWLRDLGYFTSPALIQRPPMGAGLHFAGPLPMSDAPGPYQTARNGLLSGTRAVYVADGANFPELPAKNLTLTIMANALRIGRHLASLP